MLKSAGSNNAANQFKAIEKNAETHKIMREIDTYIMNRKKQASESEKVEICETKIGKKVLNMLSRSHEINTCSSYTPHTSHVVDSMFRTPLQDKHAETRHTL